MPRTTSRYLDLTTHVAFVGDTAGIRRPAPEGDSRYVMPPTPPPDIDVELWHASIARILAWDPRTLFLTHFGGFDDPRAQFDSLREHLDGWSRIARRLLAGFPA